MSQGSFFSFFGFKQNEVGCERVKNITMYHKTECCFVKLLTKVESNRIKLYF